MRAALAGARLRFCKHAEALLQDHHGFQPRANSGPVCGLLHGSVPADGRQSQTDRRVLLQTEAALDTMLTARSSDDLPYLAPSPACPAVVHCTHLCWLLYYRKHFCSSTLIMCKAFPK
ncbi:hypothetical protein FKM82_024241 [Ascaphus truei]